MRYTFYLNTVIFFKNFIETSINVDDYLKEAVNGLDICDPLVTELYVNYSYDLKYHIFHDLVWNAITNHEIIARMTSNDTSEISFALRSKIMKEKFFEFLIYGDYNPNITVSKAENDFITEIVSSATILYDILRTCYKDVINSADFTTKAIIKIIRQHTCFIQDGISDNIPLPVIKYCKGELNLAENCLNETVDLDCFKKFLKFDSDQLSKAECLSSTISYLPNDLISKFIRENMIENLTAEIDNISMFIDNECDYDTTNETHISEINNISKTFSEEFEHITKTSIAEINKINKIIDENYDHIGENIAAEHYNSTKTSKELLNVTENISTDINNNSLTDQNERLQNTTKTLSIESQKLSEPIFKLESLVSTYAPEINTVINEKSSRVQTFETTETPNIFDTANTEFNIITSYMGVWGFAAALIFIISIIFGIVFILFKYKFRKRKHYRENLVFISS
ncbi:putative SP-containing membrane protein [Vairimorpha necatrix]|uniref:SP-containing membrane protein n=1 Tax=Vairimorpha necatrix TaxID=6039 RepID=A0AAX4JC82_9MICR